MSPLNNAQSTDAKKRLDKRLTEREDEYTKYKQFHILVGTFNVNNRQPPGQTLLEEWFYSVTNNQETHHVILPDIIAVGFQEIDTSSGAYIFDDRKKEDEWEVIVRKTIKNCYKSKDDNHKFELLDRVRLMGTLKMKYLSKKRKSFYFSSRYSIICVCTCCTQVKMYIYLPFISSNWFYGNCRE